MLPAQAHARGTAHLIKPPGKGHDVGGETMFLLLTPSTAGKFLGSTESISAVILSNREAKHSRTSNWNVDTDVGKGRSSGHPFLHRDG